jgi:hypothetical protein
VDCLIGAVGGALGSNVAGGRYTGMVFEIADQVGLVGPTQPGREVNPIDAAIHVEFVEEAPDAEQPAPACGESTRPRGPTPGRGVRGICPVRRRYRLWVWRIFLQHSDGAATSFEARDFDPDRPQGAFQQVKHRFRIFARQ